jgi:UDP-4-amino-4,6-dideoxy-N-acetyl-beta-L-altrosamine N-acetyltransferase
MIVGPRIQLRALERSDLALLVGWRNDPAIYRWFFEHEPLSLARQEVWFEQLQQKREEWLWLAETRDEQDVVGMIGLSKVDWRNRRAEMGRLIVSPGHRRHGYAREMGELVLNYAFGHLNLHRITLEVFAENTAAIAAYTHLGFREEGCLRQHVFADGRYQDVLLMAKIQPET